MYRFVGEPAAELVRGADRPALAALVIANLLPIGGVLFFDWDARAVVMLYWWENLVTGLFAVLRMMLAAQEKPEEQTAKLFAIPFFLLHYGFFCAIHGALLLGLFGAGDMGLGFGPHHEWPFPLVFVQMFVELLASVIAAALEQQQSGAELVLLALFVSHGISFVRHYLLHGEFRRTSTGVEMARPYGRIVLLHVCIIFGAFFVFVLNSPLPLLVLLILLKLAIDLALHCGSHRQTMAIRSG